MMGIMMALASLPVGNSLSCTCVSSPGLLSSNNISAHLYIGGGGGEMGKFG